MKRDIITSVIGDHRLHDPARARLPAGDHRHQPGRLPGRRQRTADLRQRQARRLEASSGRASPRRCSTRTASPRKRKAKSSPKPDPRYFQSRPSATEGGADNAAASTFSNRGPNSVKTKEADEENIKAYLELNKNPATKTEYDPGLTVAKIPVDAVNTSASGLDPEISQANAWIQAYRVASCATSRGRRSTV